VTDDLFGTWVIISQKPVYGQLPVGRRQKFIILSPPNLLVEGIGEELEFCCICAAGQTQPGNDVYSVLRSPSKCFCLPPSGGIHRSKQLIVCYFV